MVSTGYDNEEQIREGVSFEESNGTGEKSQTWLDIVVGNQEVVILRNVGC